MAVFQQVRIWGSGQLPHAMTSLYTVPTHKQLVPLHVQYYGYGPVWRYSRSKAKVVRNCTEFWMFFAVCFLAHQVANFHRVTPSIPKVSTANTLNFKPILECSLWHIVGGPPSPMGCGLANLGHSVLCITCENWGAAPPMGWNMVFWKSSFGWVNIRCIIVLVSGPTFQSKFFSSNVEGIVVVNALFHLSISLSIPEIFATKVWKKLSKIMLNFPRFLPSKILWRGPL